MIMEISKALTQQLKAQWKDILPKFVIWYDWGWGEGDSVQTIQKDTLLTHRKLLTIEGCQPLP